MLRCLFRVFGEVMDWKSALDLKAFVPAKDFAVAKQFYLDLGFTLLGLNACKR